MPVTAQDVMAAQVEAALLLAGEEQGDDDAALSPATLKKIRAVLALDPGTLANDINTEDATDGEDEDDLEEAEEGRYGHIDFSPPEGVRKAAKRGLELRREHGRGGTEVGVARARDLSNGKDISPETARRMHSYFARHAVDKKGEGWGEDSAGYIAWLLWGGDPGKAWAAKLVKQMDTADDDDLDESMGAVSTGDISQTASVQSDKRKPIEESAPGRPLIDILTDEDDEPARLIESYAGMLDDEPLMEAGDMPKNHTGFWPDSAGRNYYYTNGKRTKAPKDKEPAKKGKGKASDGEDDEPAPAKQPKPPTARQAHTAAKKDHAAAMKAQNAAAKGAMKAGKDHSKALQALSKAKSQHDTSKAKLEAAEARLQKARTTKQKAAAQTAVEKADAVHSATAEKLAAARDAEHAAREAHGAAVAAHAEHGERVKAAADALAGAAGAVAEKRPRVAKLSAEQVGKAAEAALASPADVTDEQVAALRGQLPQLGKPALASLASKAGVKGASKLRKDSLVLAITRAVEAGRGQAGKDEQPKGRQRKTRTAPVTTSPTQQAGRGIVEALKGKGSVGAGYAALRKQSPGLTLGQYQDAVRALVASGHLKPVEPNGLMDDLPSEEQSAVIIGPGGQHIAGYTPGPNAGKPLPEIPHTTASPEKIQLAMLQHAARYQASKHAGMDFDAAYQAVKQDIPDLTPGAFRDATHALRDSGIARLTGWPVRVSDMPNPDVASYVSSKAMYFLSPGEDAQKHIADLQARVNSQGRAAPSKPASKAAPTASTVKAAFRKLDPDGDNLVRMDHLQDALGIKDRDAFHAAVNDLRKAGVLTLSNYEGGEGDGIEDSLRTSSIEDRGTGRLLAYASLRQ